MDRQQINVRLTEELATRIDHRRVSLQAVLGRIPSRSEVLRLALEAYLGTDTDGAKGRHEQRSNGDLARKAKK